MVQPLTGQLQLTEPLDFEVVKDYRIRIKVLLLLHTYILEYLDSQFGVNFLF